MYHAIINENGYVHYVCNVKESATHELEKLEDISDPDCHTYTSSIYSGMNQILGAARNYTAQEIIDMAC